MREETSTIFLVLHLSMIEVISGGFQEIFIKVRVIYEFSLYDKLLQSELWKKNKKPTISEQKYEIMNEL